MLRGTREEHLIASEAAIHAAARTQRSSTGAAIPRCKPVVVRLQVSTLGTQVGAERLPFA